MEGPVIAPDSASGGGSAGDEPPPRRALKRSTRVGLVVIGVLALAAATAFGVSYVIEARNFVTTDNAQVDGDKIVINAPATGTLLDWRARLGTTVTDDQVVGRIQIPAGFVAPLKPIRAPASGTVAVDNGVEGAFVTSGTQLATMYDFSKIYITARVDETDINDVRPGLLVDISVDAYPDAAVTGVVTEVHDAAAAVFSLFPESNSSGNYQKVTQVIPVKIRLVDTQGARLVPGMNVTVKIHKR